MHALGGVALFVAWVVVVVTMLNRRRRRGDGLYARVLRWVQEGHADDHGPTQDV